MRLGAHVSTSGGIDKAVDRGQEIGAETIQLFVSSPQGWAFRAIDPGMASRFREKVVSAGISPVFLHCIYLVNLGTDKKENLSKSIQALVNYVKAASVIGAEGVIFHAGSHGGRGFDQVFPQVINSLEQVLSEIPSDVNLVLENSAGMGQHIGSSFQEIGDMAKALDSPQFRVCLDTQHLFAAGYNIVQEDNIGRVMDEFDSKIGLDRIVAVHANDSKREFSSGVDRHENIGQGYIGLDGFRTMMSHKAFKGLPFFLEVPGYDGNGPDKRNLDTLKQIRADIQSKD